MKKTLSVLLLLASTSLFASQLTVSTETTIKIEPKDYIFRLGFDLQGSRNDVSGSGSNKFGQKVGTAFELSLGSESSVHDFEFGVRSLGTLYYNGRGTFYSANSYEADVSNLGVEGTVAVFYKATQYFQPYIGVGAGINIGNYDDHGKALSESKYNPTLHGLIGVNSQLIGPIGLYAQHKYTISDESKQNAVLSDGTVIRIENRGISGSKWIAGLSLVY